MPNPENLTPFDSERAREAGKIGGSVKSPYKTWAKRRKCSPKCQFYQKCPVVTISMASEGHKCYIKNSTKEIQTVFYNLFAKGEQGLIDIVTSLHFKLIETIGVNPESKELQATIDTTLNMIQKIYGSKHMVNATTEATIIQAPELRTVLKEIHNE